MIPAILTEDKIVTGQHHGDAFSKLNNEEQNQELISGFVDYENFKFLTDNQTIYLKEIILIRHAQSLENGSLTETGCAQANKIACFISEFQKKGFIGFCSPYIRCQQTSNIIKKVSAIPFITNECLGEGNQNTKEILESLPEKSILITHSDIIQNILILTNFIIKAISNCSVTYINRNRLIWLKEIDNA